MTESELVILSHLPPYKVQTGVYSFGAYCQKAYSAFAYETGLKV